MNGKNDWNHKERKRRKRKKRIKAKKKKKGEPKKMSLNERAKVDTESWLSSCAELS